MMGNKRLLAGLISFMAGCLIAGLIYPSGNGIAGYSGYLKPNEKKVFDNLSSCARGNPAACGAAEIKNKPKIETAFTFVANYDPIGDGTAHTLASAGYTLGSARAKWPDVTITATSQLVDFCALQQAIIDADRLKIGRRVRRRAPLVVGRDYTARVQELFAQPMVAMTLSATALDTCLASAMGRPAAASAAVRKAAIEAGVGPREAA